MDAILFSIHSIFIHSNFINCHNDILCIIFFPDLESNHRIQGPPLHLTCCLSFRLLKSRTNGTEVFPDPDIFEVSRPVYFVECPFVEVCLMFPYDWIQVMHFWQDHHTGEAVPVAVMSAGP